MADRNDWIRRIQAMLEKARSTTHEAEAEALLDKTNELMEKYQIEMADLNPEDDKVIWHEGVEFSAKSHAWMWELYRAVGVYYGCDSVRESFYKRDKKYRQQLHYRQTLIGRESAILTSNLMYEFLKREVNKHGQRISSVTGLSPMAQARRVGAELVARIFRIVPKKQEARTGVAQKYVLITMDAVEAKVREHYSMGLTTGKGFQPRKSDMLSREAAMSINLNLQTKGAAGAKMIGGA